MAFSLLRRQVPRLHIYKHICLYLYICASLCDMFNATAGVPIVPAQLENSDRFTSFRGDVCICHNTSATYLQP